jgi:hypothetical protein
MRAPAMTMLFRDVGPEALRPAALAAPAGTPIDSPAALVGSSSKARGSDRHQGTGR